jgi:hypothetical protein
MFAAIEFISVLRAYITSVGDAGFGSWANTTELAVKATAKKAPPIDTLVLDIGVSLRLWAYNALFVFWRDKITRRHP